MQLSYGIIVKINPSMDGVLTTIISEHQVVIYITNTSFSDNGKIFKKGLRGSDNDWKHLKSNQSCTVLGSLGWMDNQ